MNRIGKLFALAIAVFAFQSATVNHLSLAQTPVEAIPVPEPEPADAEPGLIELDLDDEFETDDELSELDDSDEFKLIPVPAETSDDETIEIAEDDSPLLILQEEVNSSRKDVIFDPKVAPASHETVVSGSPVPSSASGQPLMFESPESESSSLEPIVDQQMVDQQMSGSPGSTRSANSSAPGQLDFVPNQPGIVAGNSTPVQTYGQRVIQPTSPPVIQPGVVYQQQPRVYCQSNSQPGVTSGNATYRYQQAQPQQVRVIRPGVATNRVPTVMQQPVAQPAVAQQGYRTYSPSGVSRNGIPNTVTNTVTNTGAAPMVRYSQNPTTVRRVVQTGPNTYRVTTETTRYVPVQVQVQQRTPVYQPGMPAQAAPVQQQYIQGRPVLNAIRGAFR